MYLDFIFDVFNENLDKTAIIYNEEEYSYKWLLDSYNKWRNYLAQKGIKNNSVVSLRADFDPDSITLLLALLEIEIIFVPLSLTLKTPGKFKEIAEVEYHIDLESEDVKFEKREIQVKHEILLDLKNRKHPGLILFSSGTTGEPKAAVHDVVPLLEKFKVRRHTLKTITFLLFDHIGGFNTLLYILANGGTIVAPEERSPEEVCKLIEKYEVELLPTSPSFINMILFSRAYKRYDLSSLKIVSYGTESMPEATLKTFHKLFPEIKLKQTYGLSEIGIMRTKSENSNSLWLKVGGEDYQTKIVDGKLWVKTRTAMLGYLNAPSPFTEDGWFNTGDKVEEKGEYIKFLGRESEIINVGGEKVYPAEVESVLLEFDKVKDVVVNGETNPIMGKIVVAQVAVDAEYANKEFDRELKKYCKSKLEKYKVPVKIVFSEETFHNERFKRKR